MSFRQSFATIVLGRSVVLREGITEVLRAAGFRIAGSQPFIDDLTPNSPLRHEPVLFVIIARDKLVTSVRQVEILKKQHDAARIAVLGDDLQENDIISLFRAGANAYFGELGTCDTFFRALELVMLGETIAPSSLLCSLIGVGRTRPSANSGEPDAEPLRRADDDPVPRLSPRESCILNCLIEGDSNKQIARKIGIAEATVKVHVKALLRKIRVHNRT